MYHVSAQGVDERMINVRYYYCCYYYDDDDDDCSFELITHLELYVVAIVRDGDTYISKCCVLLLTIT